MKYKFLPGDYITLVGYSASWHGIVISARTFRQSDYVMLQVLWADGLLEEISSRWNVSLEQRIDET